jgi:hypothetical protein
VVDVDGELIIDRAATALKGSVVDFLDELSAYCGVDIFILGPKVHTLAAVMDGSSEVTQDQRWRFAIYGDLESSEHAKTRILIFIDRLVSLYPVPY